MSTQERGRIMIIAAVLGVVVISWLPFLQSKKTSCECLEVSFLDVGQGDSILIETPDGFEMLVDGGPNAAVLRELSKERSFFDREIDMVVTTHPDLDHIGGLVDVLKRYKVKTILRTENESEKTAAAAFAAAVQKENVKEILADAGQVIQLGASTTIQIFSPAGDERQWESNTSSIVLRVLYGNTSFMLTGDAPQEIEDYLVETYGAQLDSDLLKLGHHGSKTSTSDKWLDAVTPQYAIVSASLDNRYGHPHQDVMQRVFQRNIQTSHTGTDGTITFYSDGINVWRE